MSWYVFTQNELQQFRDGGHGELSSKFIERGRWTENNTLLVRLFGPEAFVITGAYGKRPRRMAIDPPINTNPN